VNVWHAQNDSLAGWDAASIATFHDIFQQFYIGPAAPGGAGQADYWPTGTGSTKISYTPLDGSSGAYELAMAGNGAAAQAPPAEVAVVLTIRTLLRGRQNRGRIYLPGPAMVQFTSLGRVLAGYITGTLAQINAVATAIVTGGAHLGVASYGPYKNPVTHVVSSDPAINGGSSPHFTPVSSWSMDNMADVQRGRKT